MQPLFKRSITYVVKNDSSLADEAITLGRQHEFADIFWYPSQRKTVYRIDDRVSSNTSGNGLYDFIPFRSTLTAELAIVRTAGLLSFIQLCLQPGSPINVFLNLNVPFSLICLGCYACCLIRGDSRINE